MISALSSYIFTPRILQKLSPIYMRYNHDRTFARTSLAYVEVFLKPRLRRATCFDMFYDVLSTVIDCEDSYSRLASDTFIVKWEAFTFLNVSNCAKNRIGSMADDKNIKANAGHFIADIVVMQ